MLKDKWKDGNPYDYFMGRWSKLMASVFLNWDEIAKAAQPKLVVLYYLLDFGATEKSMVDEISENYKGKVILGHDLDTF